MKKLILIITTLIIGFTACQDHQEKAMEEYKRGIRHFNQSNFDEAMIAFNKAIELDNQNAQYYFYRGNIHLNKERFEKAIRDYEHALKIDSTYAKAWKNKGTAIFYKTGNKTKACPYWIKAHKLGKPNMINKIKGCPGFSLDMIQ